MRSSWLYLATLSEREGAPVLICPQPVLDGDDLVALGQVDPVGAELIRRKLAPLVLELVAAVAKQLARRGIERDRDLFTRLIAGRLYSSEEHLERLLVRAQVGREAPLIPH